jgi:hypothetical protein
LNAFLSLWARRQHLGSTYVGPSMQQPPRLSLRSSLAASIPVGLGEVLVPDKEQGTERPEGGRPSRREFTEKRGGQEVVPGAPPPTKVDAPLEPPEPVKADQAGDE